VNFFVEVKSGAEGVAGGSRRFCAGVRKGLHFVEARIFSAWGTLFSSGLTRPKKASSWERKRGPVI